MKRSELFEEYRGFKIFAHSICHGEYVQYYIHPFKKPCTFQDDDIFYSRSIKDVYDVIDDIIHNSTNERKYFYILSENYTDLQKCYLVYEFGKEKLYKNEKTEIHIYPNDNYMIFDTTIEDNDNFNEIQDIVSELKILRKNIIDLRFLEVTKISELKEIIQ